MCGPTNGPYVRLDGVHGIAVEETQPQDRHLSASF
jgi:hypothetical protein